MLPLLTTASSSPGTPELLTLALDRFPDEAILDMIVDQPHRLHEGVHGSRSNEFQPCFLSSFDSAIDCGDGTLHGSSRVSKE